MNAVTQRAIANALLDSGAVGFSPEKPITFKSGIRSPIYVDNRRLSYHPRAWRVVVEGFVSTIDTRALDYDALAGVALGGVAHCAALAYTVGKPAVIVRKESKRHGRGKRIEGGEVKGLRLLLIEDLVTTGGSSLSGVAALREAGATVADVCAIVSYGFAAAAAAFAQAGLRLHTLTNFETILQESQARGRLDAAQLAILRDWFADPYQWGREQA
ncbi:MAG: orotate phosphoribosyltransferase [Chloroflexota bacterium]|nr:orotate phosphoribosyltransferase [Chloroflexota bacterium]MCY3581559.1 orotate phosphoribosyltransferase [Chloroflexota bacterium]MDE2649754.1 orotate phosphoribosyltransferase [Chloroflexota bacterium]MXX83172.1 orotate phosphoribosyltransferase [Chloroflexota bacterium]